MKQKQTLFSWWSSTYGHIRGTPTPEHGQLKSMQKPQIKNQCLKKKIETMTAVWKEISDDDPGYSNSEIN